MIDSLIEAFKYTYLVLMWMLLAVSCYSTMKRVVIILQLLCKKWPQNKTVKNHVIQSIYPDMFLYKWKNQIKFT